jgi:putative molybdopterin biosynthesis protein
MLKVQLNYQFAADARDDPNRNFMGNPLFGLLTAVRETGSIRAAAARLDYSYRHVWGELKRWEAQLGQDLVAWGKGRHATLSPFGEKLLWAEARARARVLPQALTLQAQLERAFADAFDPQAHVLTLAASHDMALPMLRDALAQSRVHLDIRYAPSVEALKSLTAGRAQLAGFHVGESHPAGSLTARAFKGLLKPGLHKLIGFVQRQQGLMVAAGNPLKLDSLASVATTRARFANRPIGSGTRIEFEQLLAAAGLQPHDIYGYGREESTHLAVAAAVASGEADVGFGIEAAAQHFKLNFVPLGTERYYLVCLKETLEAPGVQALRAQLASEAWQRTLAKLPGYHAEQPGAVLSLTRTLPWYRYRHPK